MGPDAMLVVAPKGGLQVTVCWVVGGFMTQV